MKSTKVDQHFLKDERGAVAVITAVVLFFVLIGIAALAIDIGRLAATKNELQNAADAAALAGTAELQEIYISQVHQQNISNFICDLQFDCKDKVKNAAKSVAKKNIADGVEIDLMDEDIKIGRWSSSDNSFSSADDSGNPVTLPNAVSVIAKKSQDVNNPLSLFFARIFGIASSNVVSNESIASLTGASNMPEPEVPTPFAVSQHWFPDNCGTIIRMHPADACAGWHNFYWHDSSSYIEMHSLGTIHRHEYDGDRPLISGSDWLDANFNLHHNFEDNLISFYGVSNIEDIQIGPYRVGDEFNFYGSAGSTHFNQHLVDPNTYDGNTSDGTINTSGNVVNNPNNPAAVFALFDYFRYRDGDTDDATWSTYIPIYEESGSTCGNPSGPIEIVGFAEVTVIMPYGPPDSEIHANINCEYVFTDDEGSGITAGNVVGSIPKLVK